MDISLATAHPDLETLGRRYAAAMDRRDREALLSVFHPDASMRVEQPGREPGILRGHDELGRLTSIITRWPRTIHVLGQGLYQLDGNQASGEVYCTAHHFTSSVAGEGRNQVMHIRYLDRYQLEMDGWYILQRTVRVDATEDGPVTVLDHLEPT